MLLICFHIFVVPTAYAKYAYNSLYIKYRDELLSISVEDADIKKVLRELAYEVGIQIVFSKDLKKKVTTEVTDAPLDEALAKLLKGLSHAIVYSDCSGYNVCISKIFVFVKSKRAYSGRYSGQSRRITRQIRNYENRIRTIQSQLARTQNNRQKQRYEKQIRSYERRIESLQRRLQ